MSKSEKITPDDTSNEVLDLGSSRNGDSEVETIPLFKLDGKTYEIPAKVKAGVALRYLYEIRRVGQDAAAGRMLEDLLGEEAYIALMDSDIEMEDLTTLMNVAERHVLGAIEEAQAKESGG